MEKFYTHFDSIDSTSGYAKANLATFSKKGVTIISADEQIASYGQKKRTWLAPKGEGLWVSFCFYKENADGFILTRHMAESLLTLLKKKGVVGRIKWPNDIFVGDKKIAGILRSLEKDSENARRLTRLYNTGGRCVNPIKMIEITFEKCKILPSRDGIGLITKRCLKQTHLIGCA